MTKEKASKITIFGLFLIIIGLTMFFVEETKIIAPITLGLGIGVSLSSYSNY